MALYRFMYILNWIYRAHTERGYRHHWLVYFCGVAQAGLGFAGFFWPPEHASSAAPLFPQLQRAWEGMRNQESVRFFGFTFVFPIAVYVAGRFLRPIGQDLHPVFASVLFLWLFAALTLAIQRLVVMRQPIEPRPTTNTALQWCIRLHNTVFVDRPEGEICVETPNVLTEPLLEEGREAQVENGQVKPVYDDFILKFSKQVPIFVTKIQEELLKRYNLNVSQYEVDHVCWRTETVQEYSELVGAMNTASDDECKLLIESNIGGRPIATFCLPKGIKAGDRTIHVLEIPAPKAGSPYVRGLEHVEFVITTTEDRPDSPMNDNTHQSVLGKFMHESPSITGWNTRAKTKEINPDISLKVNLEDFGPCSVKFHLMPLADVIEYEKNILMHNEGLI
eukprot:scaffold227_cov165-Amphora_coffeaeformis.AAC.31